MLKDLALPTPDLPVIDESRLLAEFGGDQEILAELRDLFLEQAPPLYETIVQALADGDQAVLAKEAHSLKGACATYGAPRLTMVCKEIELAAKAGDVELARAYRDHLVSEFAAVREGIARIRTD